jgi:uncharacterized protein YbaR (Trm112 family)
MPVREDLLEILCCPLTKSPLKLVPQEVLDRINERIAQGGVRYESGAVVKERLEEALVTVDHQRLYAVRESIPVMLIEESIPTAQLGAEIVSLFEANGTKQ